MTTAQKGDLTMRRVSLHRVMVTVLVLGIVAISFSAGPSLAQEATPPVEELGPKGISFEPLAFAEGQMLPPSPVDVAWMRLTFAPGALLEISPDDPSWAMVHGEVGELTFRIESPITITRAVALATAMAAEGEEELPREEIPAGTEFALGPGDFAVIPPNVAGEVRNAASEPAVVVALFVHPAAVEATPTS